MLERAAVKILCAPARFLRIEVELPEGRREHRARQAVAVASLGYLNDNLDRADPVRAMPMEGTLLGPGPLPLPDGTLLRHLAMDA